MQIPFVENRGQIRDESVRYYAKANGGMDESLLLRIKQAVTHNTRLTAYFVHLNDLPFVNSQNVRRKTFVRLILFVL